MDAGKRKGKAGEQGAETDAETLAQTFARNPEIDSNGVKIIDAWLFLPDLIRQAMLAMVEGAN